jgi:cellulose 1,4-beta-cellobiosidase
MGNQTFYGRGPEFVINTLEPMTVVTQFITSDGTDTGDLVEIRRFYKQEDRIIHSPPTPILGNKATDSITDEFCHDKKVLFDDTNDFQRKGGNRAMGQSLDRGHVAALSLWDDVEVNMLWLDSAYPLDKLESEPGVKRGDCPGGESSTPTYVRQKYPDHYVRFANAAFGEIGSTLIGSDGPFPTEPPPPCVDGCKSKPGQNTPECSGQTKARCEQMAQYENKCQWNQCPSTTTMLPTTTSTPPTTTSTLAPSTSSEPTCELDRNMRACVARGGSFECEKCNDSTGEPCCSCDGIEDPETTTETITTTTISQTATTSSQAATTSSQAAKLCKKWCANNPKSWEKKCRWQKCAGCSPCSARRLRGSDIVLL